MKSLIVYFCVMALAIHVHAQTWSVLIPNRSVYSIAIDPTNSQKAYAGNVGRLFFKSTDGGQTWEERVIQDLGGASQILLLAVHPTQPNILFAGGLGFAGLDKSTDEGETWTNVFTSPDGFRLELGGSSALAFHPTEPNTMYVVRFNNGVVYKSTNTGDTWDSLGVPPGLIGTERMRAITVCPTDPSIVLVAGRVATIWRSTDGGSTFAASTTTYGIQPDMDVANFAWSPSTPGTVYATAGYSLRLNTSNGGLVKSTDYGATWNRYRYVDTSLYALAVNSTPLGDELFVGGNQVDYPNDSGYIRGDSIVKRVTVWDSTSKDISDVTWTENEVGVFGANVWGFGITHRNGLPILLMASDGGLFTSNEVTSVKEVSSSTSLRMHAFAGTDGIALRFDAPPGACRYVISTLDGRQLAQAYWDGVSSELFIPLPSQTLGVAVVQVVTRSANAASLIVR